VFEGASLRFEPRDVVIDFRSRGLEPPAVATEPEHELTSGWQDPTEKGVESVGNRSVLTLRLPVGGQRTLFLQCRADRDRRPPPELEVVVNGSDCGSVRLSRTISVHRLELPEGLVTAGENRIVLHVQARGGSGRPSSGRSVLVRRVVLAEETDAEFGPVVSLRPAYFNRNNETVVIQGPGRLLVQLDAPEAGSSLTFDYRFREPRIDTRCPVGVGRWFADRGAIDTIGEGVLTADSTRNREFWIYLGHHVGPSVLWIEADRQAAAAGLMVSKPRFTVE
jgi:hypothetical protein